jgi:hypothetical protein
MRTLLLAMLILALPAAATPAQQVSPPHPHDKPAPSDRLLPLKGTASGNSCAAFGAGFVKVEGSGTCVKIGGATSIGVGTSSGGR